MSFPYPHQCLDHSRPCGSHTVLPFIEHLGTTLCKLLTIFFNFLQFGHFDPQVEAQCHPIIDLLQLMYKVSQLRSCEPKRYVIIRVIVSWFVYMLKIRTTDSSYSVIQNNAHNSYHSYIELMYLPTVRLAHCEVSLPAELETTHR